MHNVRRLGDENDQFWHNRASNAKRTKFPYFADTIERGDRGWKQAQREGDKVTIDNSKVCMYNNNNKNFKEKLSQFLLSSSTWSSSYCIIPKKNTPKTWSLTPISMQRVMMIERTTYLGWCSSSSTVLKVHYFGMWALRNFVTFRLVRELHPSRISKEHKSDWVRAWSPFLFFFLSLSSY
jgi:hypothetical protein